MTVHLSRINSELNYDGRCVGKCGGDGGVVPGGDLHDSPAGARRGWRGHKASKRAYGSRGHRLAPVPCNSRFVGGSHYAISVTSITAPCYQTVRLQMVWENLSCLGTEALARLG